MTSLAADRLYALLPAVYRIRDQAQGEPLRALVGLIAKEFQALEENVEQLYDDQFIETCADWVAPYIGDLIGYRPLHGVAPRIASPRAEVANTIAYRRRKGTAAMLEQLARDVTDWPARAVEFFEQLAVTQYMNHLRPHSLASANLRSVRAMRQLGGAFNTVSHTPEMRRPEGGSGRYNIPNVGIFLWRLQPHSLTDVPLLADPGDPAGRRLRFNPLGADRPLFRLPLGETVISHIAEPANVPDPIDLRLMALDVRAAQVDPALASDYGRESSIVLARPNADPSLAPVPVPLDEICVCDLRDVTGGWAHEAVLAPDRIAIDPRLGRVLLGSDVSGPILGTHPYGFPLAIGGGEYERIPAGAAFATQRTAAQAEALQPHLDAIAAGGRLLVEDSLTYVETPTFRVDGVTDPGLPGLEVVVAAANGARPLLAAGAAMDLLIGARGTLVLEGLVISGGALRLAAAGDDEPRHLVLRHCTLVPGLGLQGSGDALSPGVPSLVVTDGFATVTLERCIVGALRVVGHADLKIVESIVDSGGDDGVALEGEGAGEPGASLTICDSTVFGKVHVGRLPLRGSRARTIGAAGHSPGRHSAPT